MSATIAISMGAATGGTRRARPGANGATDMKAWLWRLIKARLVLWIMQKIRGGGRRR
jgi:hypothetical protein